MCRANTEEGFGTMACTKCRKPINQGEFTKNAGKCNTCSGKKESVMSKAQQLLKTMQEVKVPQNYEEDSSLPGGPGSDTITLYVDADNETILLMQDGKYVELTYDHYTALRKQLSRLIGDGTLEPWPR